MNYRLPASLLQVFHRKAGIISPSLIDEIGDTVVPIAAGQYRNRVDRHLKLSFGLANLLFGPPSLRVLGLQRLVESFEIVNRCSQVIAGASKRVRGALLR